MDNKLTCSNTASLCKVSNSPSNNNNKILLLNHKFQTLSLSQHIHPFNRASSNLSKGKVSLSVELFRRLKSHHSEITQFIQIQINSYF
jgi:hypothetical protein